MGELGEGRRRITHNKPMDSLPEGGMWRGGGGPVASFITDLFFPFVKCTFVASFVSSHVMQGFGWGRGRARVRLRKEEH